MFCSKCKSKNKPERKFCGNCGSPLAVVCPDCYFKNDETDKFCGGCGKSLDGVAALQPIFAPEQTPAPPYGIPPQAPGAPAPGKGIDHQARIQQFQQAMPEAMANKIARSSKEMAGERRNVTILIADVTGFTDMSERLDPEEVNNKMNACFEKLVQIVYKYEGTVDKFMGDAMMALFGAPIAHEDDPQRAIKAAMEMQKIMEADAAESSLRIKVVINSGLVIAGQVGSDLRMEYSVIGDTVNVAARIEKLANAGDILVGENTYKLAKQGFTYEALPPAMVKGKKEPVQVYKVTGSRKLVETISGAGNIVYTPLIGREKEIHLLKNVFEKARAGEGQTVSLIGNAGLGKSRLMYELRTQIPSKKISYLRIECFSYTKAIPYYPFVEIIKNHFDFKDSDTRIQLDKKLKDTVAKKNMDWAVPYLKKLLSMELTEQEVLPTDPKEVKSNIFKALAGIIKSGDKNKTAILVIEDVHWLDAASLEFLDYQVKNMHDKALFLVVSRQPDICLTWEEEANHTGIEVKKLSNKEISSFLTDSLNIKNISKEFFALIKKKSDGNPLYIEELSRSLIDKNVLVKDNGNYVVQGDIADLGIPDSIQGVLMSRIDLLDDTTKKTLQFASCIGPAFERRLLEKIAPEGANIDKCLLELKIQNFIIPVEGEYNFRHAMLQETAYESLLIGTRTKLHVRIGGCIEDWYKERIEEFFEVLALHFARGKLPAKALIYQRKGADKARGLYDNQGASRLYQFALESLEQLPQDQEHQVIRIDVLSDQAHVFRLVGRVKEALENYNKALSFSEEISDKQKIAKSLSNIATAYYLLGELPKAMETIKKAIAIAEEIGDKNIQATAHLNLGSIYGSQGEYKPALTHFQQSLKAQKGLGNPRLEIFNHNNIGGIYDRLGQYKEAEHHFQQSVDIAAEIKDKEGQTFGVTNLGEMSQKTGNFEKALSFHEKARKLGKDIGDKRIIAEASRNLGLDYTYLGRFREAEEDFKTALEITTSIGNTEIRINTLIDMSGLQNLLNQPANGKKLIQEAVAMAEEHQEKDLMPKAYYVQGKLEAETENYNKALDLFKKAHNKAKESGSKRIEAWSLAEMGLVSIKNNNYTQAENDLSQAIEIERDMGDQALRATIYFYEGILLYQTNQLEKALVSLDCAEKIAKGIRILPLLKEIYSQQAQIYEADNKKDLAREKKKAAREIITQLAENIKDENLKKSFLDNNK